MINLQDSGAVAPALDVLPLSGVPPYRAPFWLPGPHAQTIYPACCAPRPRVAFTREVWGSPDGDCVGVDICLPPVGIGRAAAASSAAAEVTLAAGGTSAGAGGVKGAHSQPTVLLLHGLEGSSSSHYALELMDAVARQGWRGMVVHWRGCGGLSNLAPRAYHSGDSEEADWIIRRVHGDSSGPLYAVGVSLGGNVLLKWLGERGDEASRLLAGAAAVSVPFDLAAGSRSLERGFGRQYARYFLSTMKPKAIAMLQAHPGLADAARIGAARTLREFDDAFTAPVHGFRDAADYYARASSKRFIAGIRTPTLLISARNDPFLPAACLPARRELPAAVSAIFPESGGHAGFCSGAPPGRCDWMPAAVLHFFLRCNASHHAAAERNL